MCSICMKVTTAPFIHQSSESIEWFIEEHAFSLSYDLAPHTPHPSPVCTLSLFLSLLVRRRPSLQTRKGDRRGWNQIIRRRESLVLYKLFNIIWPSLYNWKTSCRGEVFFILAYFLQDMDPCAKLKQCKYNTIRQLFQPSLLIDSLILRIYCVKSPATAYSLLRRINCI